MPKVLFLTIVIHGMAKEGEWIDQNVDLDQLAKKIDQFFKSEGFESRIENNPSDHLRVIQAKKTGVMRSLVSSRKVMQVIIQGEPNHFTISSGMGEWGKNVAAAALIPVVGWVGLVGLGLNAVFGKKLWNEIKLSVTLLSNNPAPIEEKLDNESLDILKKRFALGEITKEEFEEMKNALE